MNRIKEVIKEKGHTITSLADKLGIARESLSRMIVSPSYPTLEKIAAALDVPMWQLFASKEEVKGDVCPHCGMPIKIKIEKGE
ncbi:helix-turn-helix domain-containing protein [Phocaeicola coprocola]|uniref:helix-turn-helix domain-containing protein n=1 Tax=Phocaeicola coprocola TaxID=310298 RepID=UPI003F8112C5